MFYSILCEFHTCTYNNIFEKYVTFILLYVFLGWSGVIVAPPGEYKLYFYSKRIMCKLPVHVWQIVSTGNMGMGMIGISMEFHNHFPSRNASEKLNHKKKI